MRPYLLLVAAGTAALLAQHPQDDDKKKRNPAMGNPTAIATGEKLFNEGCAACHGPGGQGGRAPNLAAGRVMWHALKDDDIFKTIRDGVPSGGMPPTPGLDEKIWQLAAYVRSLNEPAAEAPPPGDVALGESLFWGKAGCSGCHSIRGKGGKLGPDLTDAGGSKSIGIIRSAIVEPGANGSKGFEKVRITMRSGKVLEGVLKNYTNYSAQVIDAKGELHLLLARDVKDMAIDPKSAMPADYAKRLSASELDALVAYLSRQSARPISADAKK